MTATKAMLTMVIPLAMSLAAEPAMAGFCADSAGPDVLYCDDFSGSDPLSAYMVHNYGFPSISVVDQQLQWVNNYGGGGVSAYVVNDASIPFRDTSFTTTVEFSTPGYLRSLMGIGYYASLSDPGNAAWMLWALQLDEQNAYFIFYDGSHSVSIPTSASFAINTPYDIRLVVESSGQVSGYVDGGLVFQQTFDLSSFPTLMYPGFVGNAYGWLPETQIYTDAIARSIPELPTWTLLVVGFAALGWASARRLKNRPTPMSLG